MSKNIKKDILKKIKDEKVKMKPRWWFVARDGGLRGLWTIMILTGALLVSSAVYILEMMNPKELLEFGSLGTRVIVEDFPYLMFGGSIFLIGASIILLSKIGDNYKKNTEKLVLIVAVIITVLTILIKIIGSRIN